jgi:transcriptional regulator with XRE-family HTH domain
MASSLSAEMLSAHKKSSTRADKILERYQKDSTFVDLESFEFSVRQRFLLGVHTAFLEDILSPLSNELGLDQQEIADALGLKDRSSISQMLRSGKIDGIRITAALYQFRHVITLPTQERAALYGYARATSYIKAQALQDDSIEGSMKPQEFSYLMGALASDEWDEAIRSLDPAVARRVAVKIIDERKMKTVHAAKPCNLRPEQCVLMLQDIHGTWADYAVLALYIIPDYIPTNDSEAEVTL